MTVLTEDLRSFDMKNISEVVRRNLRNLFIEKDFMFFKNCGFSKKMIFIAKL